MHIYPIDKKTKEGNPFWTLPKRPPIYTEFNPNNKLHIDFITACSCLRAKIFNMEDKIPNNIRNKPEIKYNLA